MHAIQPYIHTLKVAHQFLWHCHAGLGPGTTDEYPCLRGGCWVETSLTSRGLLLHNPYLSTPSPCGTPPFICTQHPCMHCYSKLSATAWKKRHGQKLKLTWIWIDKAARPAPSHTDAWPLVDYTSVLWDDRPCPQTYTGASKPLAIRSFYSCLIQSREPLQARSGDSFVSWHVSLHGQHTEGTLVNNPMMLEKVFNNPTVLILFQKPFV